MSLGKIGDGFKTDLLLAVCRFEIMFTIFTFSEVWRSSNKFQNTRDEFVKNGQITLTVLDTYCS